jgi:cyclase
VHPFAPGVAGYLQPDGGWFLNNAGWVVGPDGVLLVDTCATEARTRRLLAALAADPETGSGEKAVTLALTHGHGDHANGAGLVAAAGGTVLATEWTAAMVTSGPHVFAEVFAYDGWGDIAPPARVGTLAGPRRLDLGAGRAPEVIPVPGPAHTGGDLVVWLPDQGVLFTGDLLFAGVTPLAVHGSITGWLAALDWLAEFDAAHLVPGHGPVTDDRTRVAVADYLRWLRDAAQPDEPDFAALHLTALERWPDWLDGERHAANLRIAHTEAHGLPPDLTPILALVTAAGGPITLDI